MPTTVVPGPTIDADQALAIAHSDASKAYRDLTRYTIRVALEADGWHIDYDLKSSTQKGGGGGHSWRSSDGQLAPCSDAISFMRCASSMSSCVTPPAECVEQVYVTLRQRTSMSG